MQDLVYPSELNSIFSPHFEWVWRFPESDYRMLDNKMRWVEARNLYIHKGEVITNGSLIDPSFLDQPLPRMLVNRIQSLLAGEREYSRLMSSNDTYCILNKHKYTNYYHFLFDFIPRLITIQDKLSHSIPVVSFPLKDWQKNILEYLSIESAFLGLTSGVIFRPAKSIMINITGSDQFFPESFAFYKSVAQKADKSSLIASMPSLVYISRASTGNRNLLNEDSIQELLKSRGFTIVRPENLSFLEQIQVFSSVKVVIAPSGAALANMVFSNDNCKIIEIVPEDSYDKTFWKRFTTRAGITKHYLVDSTVVKKSRHRNLSDGVYVANIDLLLLALQEIGY